MPEEQNNITTTITKNISCKTKNSYLNNKTTMLERQKYREENKETIKQYYGENKERILKHNK